jgi:hypothetical protein
VNASSNDDVVEKESLMHALVRAALETARRPVADDLALVEKRLIEDGFPAYSPVSRSFLERWYGVRSHYRGEGLDLAVEPFEIDPMLCIGEADRFANASARLATQLAPLGEWNGGQGFLAIDVNAVVYGIWPAVVTLGTADDALETLLLGRRPKEVS